MLREATFLPDRQPTVLRESLATFKDVLEPFELPTLQVRQEKISGDP